VVQARAVSGERRLLSASTPIGRLDAHDLGPQVTEDTRGENPVSVTRVDDADTVEQADTIERPGSRIVVGHAAIIRAHDGSVRKSIGHDPAS
jgi:hypothetical protein